MHKPEKLYFTIFILAWCLIAFVGGVFFHINHIFPAPQIARAFNEARAALKEPKPHHLFPIRYDRAGAATYDAAQVAAGLTLLTSYWPESDWTPGARLINSEGKTLHFWPIDPARIWPVSPHTDFAASPNNISNSYVHGTYLFPNGDLLFNLEFLGLIRMDACGEVIWKLPYRTHHSIQRTDDGNFWVSGLKWVEAGDPRANDFTGLKLPFTEDTALKVSPEGQILEEISVLGALFNSKYKYLIWKNERQNNHDVLHLNDVEELPGNLAAQFPLFAAGDLVISTKFIHAVFVMDQAGTIKWLRSDRFIQQHDPDFNNDGTISVFDNRQDSSVAGEILGGSRIAAIRPGSNDIRQLYPPGMDPAFYTYAGGKHQVLSNGNLLIIEARAGRVFEVSPSGDLVWEWIHQPYDEKNVNEVLGGTRYDYSEAMVADWSCNSR